MLSAHRTGLFFLLAATAIEVTAASPPSIGDNAPDFTLSDVQGKQVRLSEITAKSVVALVVLRGYPGYQCPYCTRQVQDYVSHAEDFAKAGVSVLFIYPGPPGELKARAAEFLAGKQFPEQFRMLLDPGYEFTNLYGLRWDAPGETAWPSTFLLDEHGLVFYAGIGKGHGGRTSAGELLAALAKQRSLR